MATLLLFLYIFDLITIFIISNTYGLNIQFFRDANYLELLWESSANTGCSNTPRAKQADVYSIKTDTCFIAYFNPNCVSKWSVKYIPGEYSLSENELTWIESYQICTEKEGGNQLNVDIIKFKDAFVADVLVSYNNICECVNVPENVQKMRTWSIDNHHNSLLAYYESNCLEDKWKPKFIASGHNLDTNFMHDAKIIDSITDMEYKIQSFGPDPESLYFQTSCFSNDATTENRKTYDSGYMSGINDNFDQMENRRYAYDNQNEHVHTDLSEHGMGVSRDPNERVMGAKNNINKRRKDANGDINKRFQVLSSQFVELQSRIDQSTQNLENFHNNVLKQHKEEFSNFTEKITELHQGFKNFTEKIKSVMHELRN